MTQTKTTEISADDVYFWLGEGAELIEVTEKQFNDLRGIKANERQQWSLYADGITINEGDRP